MADFKTIDEHLYKYIKGEVEKRFPQTCSFGSSSLGRGRLAIEDRWIKVKNNDWQLCYTSGKWTLGCTNKDIFPKVKSLLSTDKYEFDDNKKEIRTNGKINGNTYAQGEAAVLDELLTIIKTLQEISQGENEPTIEPVIQDDGVMPNNLITLNRWNLGKLLESKLEIPDYQRAYEWHKEHVKALLDDTYKAFQESKVLDSGKEYLMGTIILHSNNHSFYIVDGQQRLVTFAILLNSLPEKFKSSLLGTTYTSPSSKWYLRNTSEIIKDFVQSKSDSDASQYYEYLRGKIVFSVLILAGENALELAYTFFDSVNSKGKELSDYDLLKAHHLMFIPESQESLAKIHNDNWQARDKQHAYLFENLLMRVRRWSEGSERDNTEKYAVFNEFTSAVDLKNCDNTEHLFNHYMQPAVFSSWNRENNNVVLNQKYANQNMEDLIPIEMAQTIEGGDTFFLYAERYHKMYNQLFNNKENENVSTSIRFIGELSKSIDNYQLRWAFEAIMLFYFDKFGEQKLVETATCVELILAQARFTKTNRELGVRALSAAAVVKYVARRKLISIINRSTLATHVLAQFFPKLHQQSFVPDKELSGVRKYYMDRIKPFYEKNMHLINSELIKQQMKKLYKLSNENKNVE